MQPGLNRRRSALRPRASPACPVLGNFRDVRAAGAGPAGSAFRNRFGGA